MQKYLSIFLTAYKNQHVYMSDIIGVNVMFVLRILVIIILYRAIFEMSGGGKIAGYSLVDLAWALIVAQAVVTSKPRTTADISNDIKTGKITTYLLNPVPYIWFKFFHGFSQFLASIIPGLIIGSIVGILML